MTNLPDHLLARRHGAAFAGLLRHYLETEPSARAVFVRSVRDALGPAFVADWLRWAADSFALPRALPVPREAHPVDPDRR